MYRIIKYESIQNFNQYKHLNQDAEVLWRQAAAVCPERGADFDWTTDVG